MTESGCLDSFPNTRNPVAKFYEPSGQQGTSPYPIAHGIRSEAMGAAAGFISGLVWFGMNG